MVRNVPAMVERMASIWLRFAMSARVGKTAVATAVANRVSGSCMMDQP